MIDLDLLNQTLKKAKLIIDGSECHGQICGVICAKESYSPELFIDSLLAEQLLSNEAEKIVRPILQELWIDGLDALHHPEYAFQPLLPDDDIDLRTRILALKAWSEGFLFGFGIAGAPKLEREGLEILMDIQHISELDDEAIDQQDMEESWIEVLEFSRVAVMLLMSLQPAPK